MIRSLRRMRYVFVAGSLVVVLASTGWSFAATNTVEPSVIGYASAPITAQQLAPSACAGLGLTNYIVITGSAAIQGTNGNDLILGSPGKDNIHGNGGNDCIMGGGGADHIYGDAGYDVCIGGGDNKDKFQGCEVVIP